MSLLFEAFKAFTLGVVVYFLPPLVAGTIPEEYEHIQEAIIEEWLRHPMFMLGRAVLLIGPTGFQFKKSAWDADNENEKIRLGNGWKHYEDPKNWMGRLCGRPFGIVLEDKPVILKPSVMDFGERVRQVRKNGKSKIYNKNGETHWLGYIPVPKSPGLVSPQGARAIIPGSATPNLPERTTTFTEKGQSLYNSNPLFQYLPALMTGALVFGLIWLSTRLGSGGSGGGGEVLPLILGVGL